MLARVVLENFRCLKRVEVKLEPFTVIVGPNASGKSAVLSGLNADLGATDADRWRHDGANSIQMLYAYADRNTYSRILPPSSGWTHSGQPRHKYHLLRFDLGVLRSSNVAQQEVQLSTSGGNLPNVFATLERSEQDEVAKQLCKLVPMYSDVIVRPLSQGHHRLLFEDRWKSGLWYETNEVSDGTLLALAFLLLQHQSTNIDVVAIEEPERGLHPYLLGEVVTLLRGIAHGKVGRRKMQIIAATHSAELLDHLQPQEVRFMRRSPDDGAAQIEAAPTDTDDWRATYEEYQRSLGGLWLSGGLGGVPGA